MVKKVKSGDSKQGSGNANGQSATGFSPGKDGELCDGPDEDEDELVFNEIQQSGLFTQIRQSRASISNILF